MKNGNTFRHIGIILIAIIFSSAFNSSVNAQTYESHITKVTDLKGNSAGGTFSIVEDSDGFIWFGTVEGLYRYDGNNFKKFRHDNNPESLSSNTIRALCIDDEKLWIGTQGGGLNCLDLQTEKITKYINTGSSENEISNNSIWSLMLDSNDDLWIGFTEKGIDKFDKKTKQFKNYDIFGNFNVKKYETTTRALYEDKDGIIWAGISNYGLIALDPLGHKFKSFIHKTGALNSSAILAITGDNKGNILISTYGGGINIYNKRTESFSYITNDPDDKNSLISDLTYGITEDNKGQYWIATEYGISVINIDENLFTNYQKNTCVPNTLSDNRVRTIFIDSNKIIWIGTESDVNKIIQQNNFLLHKNIPGDSNSLPKGIVRAVYEDNEANLWIGLIDYGLVFYDQKNNTYSSYKKFFSESHKSNKKHITSILQDSNDDIWIGEWDSGLFKLNKATGVFEHKASILPGENQLSGTRIQKITEDKPGFLWIATESGINYYDIKKNKCYQMVHDPDNENSISGNAVQSNAIVKDNEGNLWVGIWSGGLNKITYSGSDMQNVNFKCWRNDPLNIESLSNDNVISLYYNKQNVLWIGTFGGGLSKFDPKTAEFKHYTTLDGLPNNIIFSIIEDQSGFLWLSTDGGLSKFDPIKETFKNYYQSDGLQSDHFFWGSSHKGKSGKFYFGGINGFNSFNPDSVFEKAIQSQIILLSLKIFNNEYTKSSVSKLKKIELKYNENFLTFEFAAVSYIDSYRIRYQYKMDGIDENWNNNNDRRYANYTDLAPGKYRFRVRTTESSLQKSNIELSIYIIISPPWWATWWARTIFIIFIVFVIFAFYYIRVGILESQKRKLKVQVEQRTYEINKSKNELANKNEELTETLNKLEITQKALIESEKMASIGIMSAGIAHEINNPLNFIAVSIENIKTQIEEIDKERNAIDKENIKLLNSLFSHSETGISRISNIIKSLRTYAHKGEGKKKAAIISDLIESAITILHSKIPEYITFTTNYGDIPKVLCKADQISQVLLNLIDNAVDAIEEEEKKRNEQIIITTEAVEINNSKYVLVSILNTGTNISDDKIKHIFDPFYTTKSPNEGTGLGLYISYNIINDHNGILKVENTSDGVKFLVYLPTNNI